MTEKNEEIKEIEKMFNSVIAGIIRQKKMMSKIIFPEFKRSWIKTFLYFWK